MSRQFNESDIGFKYKQKNYCRTDISKIKQHENFKHYKVMIII